MYLFTYYKLGEKFGDGIGNLIRENEWDEREVLKFNNRLFVLSFYCFYMELLK